MSRVILSQKIWQGKNAFKGLLTTYKAAQGYDNDRLAALIGIGVGTLQNRLNDPGAWRLSELERLSKRLRIPTGELVEILHTDNLVVLTKK